MVAPTPFAGPAPTHRRPADGVRTLIDVFLDEQRSLGAAERFARWHEHASTPPLAPLQPSPGTSFRSEPDLAPHYRRLLPVSAPVAGQQLAFDVDLDACSGCKACVTACHSLNGLEPGESWRSVGLLVETSAPTAPRPVEIPWSVRPGTRDPESVASLPSLPRLSPAFQHVTHACHHCVEPACAHGCPVLAYDKDPVTGIVRHLDDQCIGCSYCQMTCPYEVPRFSKRLGIVRKCDLCHGRLAAGEAPACVQSCPSEAIRIVVVETDALRAQYREIPGPDEDRPISAHAGAGRSNPFLPDSPPPHLTVPGTRFRWTRSHGGRHVAADAAEARPAAAHVPLVWMLVLSQAAVGISVAEAWARVTSRPWPASMTWVALGLLHTGLLASVAHLGQPFRAWRAFLGWRRSWLSREILALTAFAGMLMMQALLPWVRPGGFGAWGTLATALSGMVGVFASVRVYSATGREFWSFPRTAFRFYGTVGLSVAWVAVLLDEQSRAAWLGLATVVIARLAGEALPRRHRRDSDSALARSAVLLAGSLRPIHLARVMLLLGGMLTPWFAAHFPLPSLAIGFASVGLLAAECCERLLFFRAVSPHRMPGQPA